MKSDDVIAIRACDDFDRFFESLTSNESVRLQMFLKGKIFTDIGSISTP